MGSPWIRKKRTAAQPLVSYRESKRGRKKVRSTAQRRLIVDTFGLDVQVEPDDAASARATIAAGTVFGLANAEQRIGPRLDRDGVEALLHRSGMADQMKFLMLWDDWESGRRGRQAKP